MEGRASPLDQLSDRELQSLRSLAAGLSDQQIADGLFLSLNTVKWYNRQIYSKLGVASRTQAVAQARPLGLLGPQVTAPPSRPLGRLPRPTSRFIGRTREIAEVIDLLRPNRLLTLAGTAGVGKARLALRAAERLDESGESQAVRRPHAEYFVHFAERAEPELRLAGYCEWCLRLELEMDNLRTALAWALGSGEVEWAAGQLTWAVDLNAAQRLFQKAAEIAWALGDPIQAAFALTYQAYATFEQPESGLRLAQQGLDGFREQAHQLGIAQALNVIGEIARLPGDDRRAGRVLGAVEAELERRGEYYQPTDKPVADRIVGVIRAEWGEEAFQAAWADGRRMSLEAASAEALRPSVE